MCGVGTLGLHINNCWTVGQLQLSSQTEWSSRNLIITRLLLPIALAPEVMQSPPSVRLSVSTASFEPLIFDLDLLLLRSNYGTLLISVNSVTFSSVLFTSV